MNYQKVYEAIIIKAKSENRQKLKKTDINYVYYENHHILPRCLNGKNIKENLVLLTAREHFICHKLLTYIFLHNRKIALAFHKMCYSNHNDVYNVSSKDYAYARELISSIPISEETRKKFNNRIPWNKGLTKNTDKRIEKQIDTRLQNLKNGNFSYKGINNPMYGKKGILCPSFGLKRSSETKQKMKESKMGKNNPNAGEYEICSSDGKFFVVEGATTFIKEHPEYNINRHFIYNAASQKGNLYEGWRVKKLN